MTGTKAIEGLDALRNAVEERVRVLGNAIRSSQEQWAGLGRAGGQRDDHAAALLAGVERAVFELTRFGKVVHQQLIETRDKPFGE